MHFTLNVFPCVIRFFNVNHHTKSQSPRLSACSTIHINNNVYFHYNDLFITHVYRKIPRWIRTTRSCVYLVKSIAIAAEEVRVSMQRMKYQHRQTSVHVVYEFDFELCHFGTETYYFFFFLIVAVDFTRELPASLRDIRLKEVMIERSLITVYSPLRFTAFMPQFTTYCSNRFERYKCAVEQLRKTNSVGIKLISRTHLPKNYLCSEYAVLARVGTFHSTH